MMFFQFVVSCMRDWWYNLVKLSSVTPGIVLLFKEIGLWWAYVFLVSSHLSQINIVVLFKISMDRCYPLDITFPTRCWLCGQLRVRSSNHASYQRATFCGGLAATFLPSLLQVARDVEKLWRKFGLSATFRCGLLWIRMWRQTYMSTSWLHLALLLRCQTFSPSLNIVCPPVCSSVVAHFVPGLCEHGDL